MRGNSFEDFPSREKILRRFLAAAAGCEVVALRHGPCLTQLFDTRSLRKAACGILQQIFQIFALFIALLQQVPHPRLLIAVALNLHASLPGLPPGAGPERVSLSPCCRSGSELPRSPRWRTLPLLSASASAGPVHPILPAAAPRAPAPRASR